MIVAYHRPRTLEDALALLRQAEPPARPVAGGLFVLPRAKATPDPVALVDVQDLDLKGITVHHGRLLRVGATTSLQALLESPTLPAGLDEVLLRAMPLPQRGQATVAGSLMAARGTSLWAAAIMALDARAVWAPGVEETHTPWGDIFAWRARYRAPGWLITAVEIPLAPQVHVATVSRSPADRPLVLVAAARWPRGRVRLVVGGWGAAPRLVLDGPDATGWEVALDQATASAEDSRATQAYRAATARVLAQRALAAVGAA